MANIRVGNDGCTFNKVIRTAKKCASFAVLEDNWPALATELDTPDLTVRTLRNEKRIGAVTLTEVITKLLVEWACRTADQATLEMLAECFLEIKMKDIRDELLKTFVNVSQRDILAQLR